ncbi:MAG TPA: YbjN domain-containing protein [Catenuloplanes sp.]|jgi:hypothetical protein
MSTSGEIEPRGADPGAGEVHRLLPLSAELITNVLDARQFKHFTDDDGDIAGQWDGNLIYFFRLGRAGEMLQVRTLTSTDFTVDDVPRLYAFCNAWNHDKLWPKAYVHVGDDGTARVVGEVLADLEKGVALPQLDQLIACGVVTGCQLADAVAELRT